MRLGPKIKVAGDSWTKGENLAGLLLSKSNNPITNKDMRVFLVRYIFQKVLLSNKKIPASGIYRNNEPSDQCLFYWV